ncbi:MAG: hypothetical protein JSU63_19925 [Phycisphaerales bacterium]|nr:MAG: hypothetical protein JSU63_19925 [Phycisphaerales bacterium]
MCGHARAMLQRFRAEQAAKEADTTGEVAMALREAMNETDVLHYDLDIEISDIDTGAETFSIAGSNRITIRSLVPDLTEFTFRLHDVYAVSAAYVNDTTPIVVTITSATTRVATLDRTYGVDEEFTLTIEYSGTYATDTPYGGYVFITTQAGIPVIATMSAAYGAFTWWPCKDGDYEALGDNSDKALTEFSITVADNFFVPSNGVLQSTEPLLDNRVRYTWATINPMTTYHLCFAVSEYESWHDTYDYSRGSMPVDFYIWAVDNTAAHRAVWNLNLDMLPVFSSLWGEYPFVDEKYGIYEAPWYGGMEHQTMTGQGGAWGWQEWLNAHELAHSWWGNMITCETWSDTWLNEGFAVLGEALWFEFKYGTQDVEAYIASMQDNRPFGAGAGNTVYIYPEDLTEWRIWNHDYTYNKAAWVLHMLRHLVGDATFFDIIANYRAAYEYDAATTEEFIAVVSSTYGQDLHWFFDQWVYNAGAPTYRYGWQSVDVYGQNCLHLQIEQVQNIAYPVFTMPVDVVATIDGSPQTLTVWNDARSQRFTVPVNGAVTDVQFDPMPWILRNSVPYEQFSIMVGDTDGNLAIDMDDFAVLEGCYTGPGVQLAAGCEALDFDGDGDIDCIDWRQFAEAWTGPGERPTFGPCPYEGPLAAPAPHDTRKNRYISFDPSNEDAVAFQVELAEGPGATGALGWVGEPIDPSCQNEDGSPNGNPCDGVDFVARVVDTPAIRTWNEETVHLTGCEIVPVATYELRASPDGVVLTLPLEVGTIIKPTVWYYGDTVGVGTGELLPAMGYTAPNQIVNVNDVTAYLLTVDGDTSPSVHPTWVDLHGLSAGAVPNYILNVSDLQRILFGLEGQEYTDASDQFNPADCP